MVFVCIKNLQNIITSKIFPHFSFHTTQSYTHTYAHMQYSIVKQRKQDSKMRIWRQRWNKSGLLCANYNRIWIKLKFKSTKNELFAAIYNNCWWAISKDWVQPKIANCQIKNKRREWEEWEQQYLRRNSH